MAKYAIGFDLDNSAMKTAGLSKSQIVAVYQKELPKALSACGFTMHLQGSLYATGDTEDPLTSVIKLQGELKTHAPTFCKYVSRVHVFRMEDWSDVTPLITGNEARPMTNDDLPLID